MARFVLCGMCPLLNVVDALQARPKILVLATKFPAFSETFIADHVVGLARHGWDVMVAAAELDGAALAALKQQADVAVGGCVIRRPGIASQRRRLAIAARHLLPRYPQGFASSWLRHLALKGESIGRLVRELQPRVIHAHFGPNALMASFAARASHVPLLVDFHGYDVTSVPKQRGWQPYRRLLGDARAIAHSTFVEDRVRAHVGIPVERINYGVASSLFAPPCRPDRWPARIRLMTVGRLVWQKGHHVAIEALALLRRRLPQHTFSLTVCGDGPLRTVLPERAAMYGVADAVHFSGALPYADVAKAMADAEILLVPSVPLADGWQEAFCRVAVEGMAMGMGVVGTDTGGLAETMGEGGVVVRPGSAPAIAEAVAAMLESSSPRDLAERARRRGAEFPIESMWSRYDALARRVSAG